MQPVQRILVATDLSALFPRAEDDVWRRPSEAPADDSLGHRAPEGGRGAAVGRIAPVQKAGRRPMR
ncbi:hypothetical protein [Sorangium sp. So ce542]|uniref:hypothetical protein n=1 Tax=Sorangium sp. So ce542 TaxID=3133316 RepID=UPI003F62BEC7